MKITVSVVGNLVIAESENELRNIFIKADDPLSMAANILNAVKQIKAEFPDTELLIDRSINDLVCASE
jgi:hypothetical protein